MLSKVLVGLLAIGSAVGLLVDGVYRDPGVGSAYALAGILLLRRRPWGYVLAAVVLIAGVLQQVEYAMALVFQANTDIPGAIAFDPIEPFIISAYLVGTVTLLSHVRGSGSAR